MHIPKVATVLDAFAVSFAIGRSHVHFLLAVVLQCNRDRMSDDNERLSLSLPKPAVW